MQLAGATTQAKTKPILDFLSLLLFRPSCPFISVSLSFDFVSFSIWVLISLALTGNHANSKSNYFLGCTVAVWGVNYSNC